MNIETAAPIKSSDANPSGEKLQKILAGVGIGSRREMERWITEGRVSINGKKASIGDRAQRRDSISVDGRPVKRDAYNSNNRRVIAYNKPEGEICSRSDSEGRPSIFDKLPHLKGERWIAIGRLDLNTSGLLLLTTDGELANRLMHPSNTIEREYAVRVMGNILPQHIKKLYDGVELDDGPARFTDIVSSGGAGINRWFHVCLAEGRNREVRRLWESQGLTVSRLKRVRFGSTIMPDGLRVGRWKELEKKQVDLLSAQVDLEPVKTYAKKKYELVDKQVSHLKHPRKKSVHNRVNSNRPNKIRRIRSKV
ncbi:MAG: pseudouridine synthase [Candidatus Endonucleobacter bathymodioli]|uniref:Pseudouridine synthase n=1 Tax=Candidatus Endonucleibacter bathymodioli TaxID=539814 RepID=A0AA90SST9_9GAMM|nr:pseudouridine synthase [Candidatus Endonucleobacter bathymodioli]